MKLINAHIAQMAPYPLGIQPKKGVRAIKLNQNENPYPPSPLVEAALRQLNASELRQYPEERSYALREALASLHQVDVKRVFCGNGSSEIISLIFKALISEQGTVAVPYPSFSLYHTVAQMHQVDCIHIPTREDFTIDVDSMLASRAAAIIMINPNAPTGLLLPLTEIERIAEIFQGLIVIDEAYIDFVEPGLAASAVSLVSKHPHLIVLRTFSKSYSLCGARVGYCIANPLLIEALDKCRDTYNVNAISEKLALAALQDQTYVSHTVRKIQHTRVTFSARLRRLGLEVIPSQTNFVLCRLSKSSALEVYEQLLRRGIYVRYFANERLDDKLRISIGTDEEMNKVYSELRTILGNSNDNDF
jgi:histidinol-phosphate aminotransferase